MILTWKLVFIAFCYIKPLEA